MKPLGDESRVDRTRKQFINSKYEPTDSNSFQRLRHSALSLSILKLSIANECYIIQGHEGDTRNRRTARSAEEHGLLPSLSLYPRGN
jgi:hypothetical protein